MNGKKYLKTQIASMWHLQDSACKDVSDDLVNEKPQGTLSSIGVIWLHLIKEQDNFVAIITEKPPLWKTNGWHERFGLEKAPSMGEDWSHYENLALSTELLRAYDEAVRNETRVVLEWTHSNSLDQTVKFFTDNDSKANVWALMISHTLIHCGEIAALKGIFGQKGLPF